MSQVEQDPESQRPGGSPRDSWPRNWARAVAEIGSVRPERRVVVLREIDQGSQPTAIYYVLLGLSEVIAGFALIVGSDATLIGANVVAPLMTPIFGVSLGLLRGDLHLLRKALRIEDRTAQSVGEPVALSVWARTELQVTGKRYEPLAPNSRAATGTER